jgi:hypothetical protein
VFEENIFQLLPQTGDEAFRVTFLNIKLKDKIFVQAAPIDESQESGVKSQEELAEALGEFFVADEGGVVEGDAAVGEPSLETGGAGGEALLAVGELFVAVGAC